VVLGLLGEAWVGRGDDVRHPESKRILKRG